MIKPIATHLGVGAWLLAAAGAACAQSATVYRCPGPPVLYTDQITTQQAKERDCRTIEGAPITVVSVPKPRPVTATQPREGRNGSKSDSKFDPAEQRARDSDARKILETELKREEAKLAELQQEFNNGAPERQGGEQNYQKYLDRVEQMKTAVERKQGDVAALKRELTKLPSPKE